jgi:ADP-ribose pyrophosphatase YjhB (NUDIX family)
MATDKRAVVVGAVAAVGAAVLAAIQVMVDKSPSKLVVSLAAWLPLGYLIVLVLVGYVGYELGRRFGAAGKLGRRSGVAADAGLVRSYANRDEARTDILCSVRQAAFVKVLSNKGDEWLSTTGLIVSALAERASRGDRVPVQLLLLHVNSPWLLGRAEEKGFWKRDRERIRADFNSAHERVLECRPTPEVEAPHFHKHDPSWRFLMTDKSIFLQSYATYAQINNEMVLQFSRESPIYGSALRHFDFVYELDSAERDQISRLEGLRQKPRTHEISAGMILTRTEAGRRSTLVLWKDGEYWFSKGGVQHGEELVEAACRELTEETGVVINARSAKFVRSVIVEQPFHDLVSLKTILFFHQHLDQGAASTIPRSTARWADAEQLSEWKPRYEYVPELLPLIGIHPDNSAATIGPFA